MSETPQRLCWNCDAVVPGKVQFCPNCNSLQKEMGTEMLAEPRTRGTTNMTQFFVTVAVIVVLAIAGIFYLTHRNTGPVAGPGNVRTPAGAGQSPNEITPAQHDLAPGGEGN